MCAARVIVCSMEYGVDLVVDFIELLSFILKCVWAPSEKQINRCYQEGKNALFGPYLDYNVQRSPSTKAFKQKD